MIPFAYDEPASLAEAVGLLNAEDPSVRAIAGGTALMLMMKSGVFQPSRLVGLRRAAPGGIARQADGSLVIGALTTLSEIEHSAVVAEGFPVLVETLRRLANPRVRNVARIGGTLAHGDPHMDLPPVLMALQATLAVIGPQGERSVPVEALYAGYYETVLARNELIASVHVPPLAGSARYVKVTTRTADDWPALGIAVCLGDAADGRRGLRVVVSAATEKTTRLLAAEAVLREGGLDVSAFMRAGEAAAAESELVGDARGSVPYKRALLRVHLARALQDAASRAAKQARSF